MRSAASLRRHWTLVLWFAQGCALDSRPSSTGPLREDVASSPQPAWGPASLAGSTAVATTPLMVVDAGVSQPAAQAERTATLVEAGVSQQADPARPAPEGASDSGSTQGVMTSNLASDAAAGCPADDGAYCGGHGIGGAPHVLYVCAGGELEVSEHCDEECVPVGPGGSDHCVLPSMTPTMRTMRTMPMTPTPACPNGDGMYCGGHGVIGDADVLFHCASGDLAVVSGCEHGCEAEGDGGSDRCATVATPSCPLGDGLYCGARVEDGVHDSLYFCAQGVFQLVQACQAGCERSSAPGDDRCRDAPADCPAVDGTYCGGHGVAGSGSTLFTCSSRMIRAATACAERCELSDSAGQDRCSQLQPPPAGGPPGAPGGGFPPGGPPPGGPPPDGPPP